jgi:hypothetical protein
MSKKARKAKTVAKPDDQPVIKTTVHLPEPLWRQAKIAALQDRKDLRDLIIEGLQTVLAAHGRGGT